MAFPQLLVLGEGHPWQLTEVDGRAVGVSRQAIDPSAFTAVLDIAASAATAISASGADFSTHERQQRHHHRHHEGVTVEA